MNRLPANQKHRPHGKRWQRYEKPQPGHRLQLDVKFLERIPGTQKRLYQFTAIDDCTRIRVLKVYDACNQRDGDPFIDEVVRRLPVPHSRHSDRQRRRVPVALPLASRGARHPPRLHPPADAASERQSRALTPRRRPGVLPAAGQGRHHRRHPPVQREAARVGGLLQLPPAARGARRPDAVRTVPRTNTETVTHGLYCPQVAVGRAATIVKMYAELVADGGGRDYGVCGWRGARTTCSS